MDAGLAEIVLCDGWNFWRWATVALWIDVMECDAEVSCNYYLIDFLLQV